MRQVLANSLRTTKRGLRLFFSRIAGDQHCAACGFTGRFITRKALWPELIAEWELSREWTRWFDLREGQVCPSCGCNLRSEQLARVLLELFIANYGAAGSSLDNVFDDPKVRKLNIAEINSAGGLHRFLAKAPTLRYSEFGGNVPGVPSEDLMNLSYADETFDLVITSETLEHVPDVDRAQREIRRVLKKDGIHLFTVPIVWDRPKTRPRAQFKDGKLIQLLPPSYHGAPREGKKDFLVFHEFGSDFVGLCKMSGFDVTIRRDDTNPALTVFIAHKST